MVQRLPSRLKDLQVPISGHFPRSTTCSLACTDNANEEFERAGKSLAFRKATSVPRTMFLCAWKASPNMKMETELPLDHQLSKFEIVFRPSLIELQIFRKGPRL